MVPLKFVRQRSALIGKQRRKNIDEFLIKTGILMEKAFNLQDRNRFKRLKLTWKGHLITFSDQPIDKQTCTL